jgi:uncharacterized membrane protein required for colicin V production
MAPKQEDAADLARFGYAQQIDRALGSVVSFAATFSFLSLLNWPI